MNDKTIKVREYRMSNQKEYSMSCETASVRQTNGTFHSKSLYRVYILINVLILNYIKIMVMLLNQSFKI